MNEKKKYVEPMIESVDLSVTGESCEAVGPVPPPDMMCNEGPVQSEGPQTIS